MPTPEPYSELNSYEDDFEDDCEDDFDAAFAGDLGSASANRFALPIVTQMPQPNDNKESVSNDNQAQALANLPAIGRSQLHNQNNDRNYPLQLRLMTCGRDRNCDIPLDDANASRQHVRFEQNAAGTWKIIDLNSTNGTQLNGRLITRAILRNGDAITIGMTVLEFWENQSWSSRP
jgi:pSer/pThr/pTyr-binding forkhead associated (FHA) protein